MRENELSAWEQTDGGDVVRRDCNRHPIATVCEGDGWYAWQVFAPDPEDDDMTGTETAMDVAHDAADAAARKMGWRLR